MFPAPRFKPLISKLLWVNPQLEAPGPIIGTNTELRRLGTYFHHVRCQVASEDGVQTHKLMAMPVPNMEKRCTMMTLMLGRELREQTGTGLSDRPLRKVTLASQLGKEKPQELCHKEMMMALQKTV